MIKWVFFTISFCSLTVRSVIWKIRSWSEWFICFIAGIGVWDPQEDLCWLWYHKDSSLAWRPSWSKGNKITIFIKNPVSLSLICGTTWSEVDIGLWFLQSLCNACGIRSRKKRRASLGLNKEDKKSKRASINGSNNNNNHNNKISNSLKQRLLALGREVLMQRSTVERQRKKLGEEEEAAVLLMALSYGSVYA